MELIQQWQYAGKVRPALLRDEAFEHYKRAGLTSVESYLTWAEVEKGPGRVDSATHDPLVERLQGHSLKWVLVIVQGRLMQRRNGSGTPRKVSTRAAWSTGRKVQFSRSGSRTCPSGWNDFCTCSANTIPTTLVSRVWYWVSVAIGAQPCTRLWEDLRQGIILVLHLWHVNKKLRPAWRISKQRQRRETFL